MAEPDLDAKNLMSNEGRSVVMKIEKQKSFIVIGSFLHIYR